MDIEYASQDPFVAGQYSPKHAMLPSLATPQVSIHSPPQVNTCFTEKTDVWHESPHLLDNGVTMAHSNNNLSFAGYGFHNSTDPSLPSTEPWTHFWQNDVTPSCLPSAHGPRTSYAYTCGQSLGGLSMMDKEVQPMGHGADAMYTYASPTSPPYQPWSPMGNEDLESAWTKPIIPLGHVKQRRSSGMLPKTSTHHHRSTTVPAEKSFFDTMGLISPAITAMHSTPTHSKPELLWPNPLLYSPTLEDSPFTKRYVRQNVPSLRFHIVLQACTAITQISDGSPTTYLNRGQVYGIHLQDTQGQNTMMTSTFVIMFHEPSHRKAAINYWKFWLSQQKDPYRAQAIVFDSEHSVGIHNIRFPSFDRLEFDWNGRLGATLGVRFNCLSTDFSRIKGVKGIHLRAFMQTKAPVSPVPDGATETFCKQPSQDTHYTEQSYCKIKLFRDKGAERKNKDDIKQIGKQIERVCEGSPNQHPLWLMYNPSQPVSVLNEIPTSVSSAYFDLLPSLLVEQQAQHGNDMVTPAVQLTHSPNGSPVPQDPLTLASTLADTAATHTAKSHTWDEPMPCAMDRMSASRPFLKRSVSDDRMEMSDKSLDSIFYVNVKTTQHQNFQYPASSTASAAHHRQQPIALSHLTLEEFITKLCPLLSLHRSQITQVFWRRPHGMTDLTSPFAETKDKKQDSHLVYMDDATFASQLTKRSVIQVEWEIQTDGTVRIVLQ